MFQLAVISLAILLAVVSRQVIQADDGCFRLTAAFNYDGESIYLVDGEAYVVVNRNLQETGRGIFSEEFNGQDNKIEAALVSAKDDHLYFFQGNYYSHYPFQSSSDPKDILDWGDFYVGGIDAAGTLNDSNYAFSGCYYKADSMAEEEELENIGLPCNLDAAWSMDEDIYVTKGDNAWVLNHALNVTGPVKLNDLLNLTSTSICQDEKEDSLLAKIRAEQAYEKENYCVIIDAAITWRGNVYLFNDDRYVTLDANNTETEEADIFEWGGITDNIAAGLVLSSDRATYFFKGYGYYRYFYTRFLVNLIYGPFKNAHWGPFFEDGIDAAGNLGGKSYFFKGCKVAQYEGSSDQEMTLKDSADLGLPCEVDAAFSCNSLLYVIKRNQVWSLSDLEVESEGPEPLSSVVTLSSWTACAPEQQSSSREDIMGDISD